MHLRRMSQKYVAELLGVTTRTIRDWHAEGFPRNDDGSYSGPAAVAWLIERRLGEDDSPDYDDQRQRLAAAQAEKVETDNAIRRGELATRTDVVNFWTDCIANARARLLRLPSDCAAAVPAEVRGVVQDAVRRGVHDALAALAEYRAGE